MVLKTLIERISCGRLAAPAPSREQMKLLFQAALRAPDHKGIQPWHYIVFEGEEQLKQLAEIYLRASLLEDPQLTEEKKTRILTLPHRAPMVVIAVAKAKGHEKVPHIEEVLSAGAGVQSLLIGAFDLGYGAYWRTGPLAYNPHIKPFLGLDEKDSIVGFIYLGTPAIKLKQKLPPEIDEFVSYGIGYKDAD